MIKPLTKEQRAESLSKINDMTQRELMQTIRNMADSHALVDEALNLATAKLATARVCAKCDGKGELSGYKAGNCPHCTNGVVFSDERARELLERLKRAEEDSARFQWWFSEQPKRDFVKDYLQGVQEGYSIEKWRECIDDAICAARAKEIK